jgi:hypothetical protein
LAQYPIPTDTAPTFDPNAFAPPIVGITRTEADILYCHYPDVQGDIQIPALTVPGTIIAGNITGLDWVECNNIVCGSTAQVGTLKYTLLDPPIPPGAAGTLNAVLTQGNNAAGLDMTNVGTIGAVAVEASLYTSLLEINPSNPALPGIVITAPSSTNLNIPSDITASGKQMNARAFVADYEFAVYPGVAGSTSNLILGSNNNNNYNLYQYNPVGGTNNELLLQYQDNVQQPSVTTTILTVDAPNGDVNILKNLSVSGGIGSLGATNTFNGSVGVGSLTTTGLVSSVSSSTTSLVIRESTGENQSQPITYNENGIVFNDIVLMDATLNVKRLVLEGATSGQSNAITWDNTDGYISIGNNINIEAAYTLSAPTGTVFANTLEYNTLVPPTGSLASNLMPFLATDTYTVKTTSLEEEAQLALASAVVANERLDILEPIVLKIDSVSGDYTGNRGTNMIINGDIECTTLKYITLDPPISGGSETLSQVLTNGSDAGEQNITGLASLIFKDTQAIIPIINQYGIGLEFDGVNLSNIGRIDCTSIFATTGINCPNLQIDDQVVASRYAISLGNAGITDDGTVYGKVCEIVDSMTANLVIATASVECPELFINAGAASIDTLGNITCNQLNYTTLNPPISGGSQTISQVLETGSDANQNVITNLQSITANTVLIPAVDQLSNYGLTADLVGLNINAPTTTTQALIANSLDVGLGDITGGSITGQGQVQGNSLNIFDGLQQKAFISDQGDMIVYSLLTQTSVSANELIVSGQSRTSSLIVKNFITDDVVARIGIGGEITGDSYYINSGQAGIASNGKMTCVEINLVKPEFKPTYDYYVAKGGSDTGLGSILSPYLTIQQAIYECEANVDGVPRVIHVAAGSYSENLTLTKSRISIKGEGVGMHPDVGTSIYGNITIFITSGNSDMNNNNITISGFLINGSITDNTVDNIPHRIIIDTCHIYGNDRCLYFTSDTSDYRAFVSHCYISNDDTAATNPLVECRRSGMVSFNNNIMVAKGGVQNVFKLADTCRIDLFVQNSLTSDSTNVMGATAIFNHASTQTISLGMNAFIYSSTYLKQNIGMTAAAVYISNNGSLVIISNTVSLLGMSTIEKAYYNTGSGVIIFGNNQSTSSNAGLTATGISGILNVSKFATTEST